MSEISPEMPTTAPLVKTEDAASTTDITPTPSESETTTTTTTTTTTESVQSIDVDADKITPESDLSRLDRKIWIVTTAALPWRTGTSVNPLARALYLTRGRPKHAVTLMIPFLPNIKEQAYVFGKDCSFQTEQEQEDWIRNYCTERVHCPEEEQNLRIRFYSATYNSAFGSVFPRVDICSLIPDDEADVCILEEPEHLNWMRVVDEPKPEDLQGMTEEEKALKKEKAELGWAVKFTHVVGIIHTNYDAYVRQYGMGAAFLAASALHALSSMVTRAYCHRVIRLSDALPVLDKAKEITCNVHGVRSEFLESPKPSAENDDATLAPIYFIGKLMWAKGLDNMLDIEELYKKATGEYFPIDIYGSGPDEKAIKRGFFGRKGLLNPDNNNEKKVPSRETTPDRKAAGVFKRSGSLRNQLEESTGEPEVNETIEVVWDESAAAASDSSTASDESDAELPNPFVILRDLTGDCVGTSMSTTTAGSKLTKDIVDFGVHSTFMEESDSDEKTDQSDSRQEKGEHSSETGSKWTTGVASRLTKRALKFEPPLSRYELRRHPIPARFLGMKDHAVIRDLSRHKIFFNPSESEVLCTTSAEALAMGKFVVLPKHPSNTFFLQFENCLAYTSKEECVKKLKWALENNPKPLSEEEHFKLTWEGANERLFEASGMTEGMVKEWHESGRAKGDRDAAILHCETVRRGRGVRNFLHR